MKYKGSKFMRSSVVIFKHDTCEEMDNSYCKL